MPLISIPWIDADEPFPPVSTALANGLLAAGADLSTPRLLQAYQQGLFPWYNPGEPVLWWSPDPRAILRCDAFKLSKSLAKTCRRIARQEQDSNARWRITTDVDFLAVIQQCAAVRQYQEGTWISDEIIQAYYQLHLQKYAHSIEVWQDNQLVGGLYGVKIGRFFFGESMFSLVSDASKVALYYLTRCLLQLGVPYIDCQQETAHLLSLGAHTVPRSTFIELLQQYTSAPPTPWHVGQLSAQGQWIALQ